MNTYEKTFFNLLAKVLNKKLEGVLKETLKDGLNDERFNLKNNWTEWLEILKFKNY